MLPFLDLEAWLIILIISAIGLPVALGKYYMGQKGLPSVQDHFPQVTEERWGHVQTWYNRHGDPLLLATGVPGIGLLVSTGAGAVGVSRARFLVWTFFGKLLRNWILAVLAFGIFSASTGT